MDDPRLGELSGMVVVDGGLWAMSDGGRRVQVHRIDRTDCAVIDTRTAGIDPYDVEDLAVGPDGALWVGDLGDNDRRRETVAVAVLPVRGEPRLHRLTYPDGPHDAEALLVDAEGRPFVITKEVGRPAGLYRTAEPPEGEGPSPLLRVGELALPASDTRGGPVGGIGSRLVTGAAATADGAVVAVRTYTDAWLFPVSGGDLVAAFNQPPVRIPLPAEPQGEAIAFEPDGTLLSGSETRHGVRGEIRAVPGAAGLAGDPVLVVPLPPASAPEVVGDPGPPPWLPAALGGGAVVGVLLVVTAAAALRGRQRG
ncbi:MAG TPA: hypothetical protein VKZ81_33600 [Pseudonocardia sp.]|uniref:hypothetical protein n=1 Tax=Pseudonocardia sp. TaxID=60912 RepID=UPI002B4B412C|nr:hypothetical protein [Pseudonocardia sp.]HLU60421.1 hypothetical protein [Pseudonocardia sp.]